MLHFVVPIDHIACTEVQAGDSFFCLEVAYTISWLSATKNNYLVNTKVKLNVCKCCVVLV